MKYLDCFSLFEGEPAHIAIFSTFQFDPDFFERRMLKCSALKNARRILIFMDNGQWQELLRRDARARRLNRRYLVVPVHRSRGVFHPKLNLLLSDSGGQVQCGSNNLTRSGCSSNLELLNSIPFGFDEENAEAMQIASAAIQFFESAAKDTEPDVRRIALEWLAETQSNHRWLKDFEQPSDDQQIRLVHTYDRPIWDSIEEAIGDTTPKKFFVLTPFHDKDARICKRLTQQWPEAQIELLVQQGYTNLPVEPLRNLPAFALSEIYNSTGTDASRRVHAKLITWQTEAGSGCLVGSANFTSAAFEGRNIEASLLINDPTDLIEQLFDEDLTKRPIELDEFNPGFDDSPESNETEESGLRIHSAILTDAEHLRISFSHSLGQEVSKLRLAIRTPGEKLPRKTVSLPLKESSTEDLILPENTLADCKATILAYLIADLESGEQVVSVPAWIIQEDQLTHESGEGSRSSKSRIEETGDGLPEYLEELGLRDGPGAIADYLRHLNIRFNDGSGRRMGKRKFRIRVSDPFQSDIAPDWLINAKREADQVEQAIYDFVDRHIKKKLKKHSERGNINGMENFLDIFATMVKVLYRWFKLDVVKRGHLIGKVVTMLEVATSGKDTEKEWFDGYLYSVYDSIGGDVELLQEVCDENNYCGEIYAALLIVQMVRYQPGEVLYGKEILRPKQTLEAQLRMVNEAIAECDLERPSPDAVRKALERYGMLSDESVAEHLQEL